MRPAPVFLLFAALLALTLATPTGPFAQEPQYGEVEVLVTAGLDPLPGASVALDLNADGVWDEQQGEPVQWTDGAGIACFSNVVSIQDPGGGASGDAVDWQPTRIMMGNLRGAIGASDVQVDFVLPAGSSLANLGLFDLKGRRMAQTGGTGDLTLSLPGGLPSGVYFLRLSADPSAPASQRITSVGVRTQTIRATRVSAAEAVAAGWVDDRPADRGKGRLSEDPPHHVNLIVAHAEYPTAVQAEIIEPGFNSFTVDVLAGTPEGFVYIPPGTFTMGSPDDEPGRFSNEVQHEVELTQGFYMSQYEVTEAWWYEVMGGTPTTSQLPKIHVSWDQAVQFCNALSSQQGLTPAYTIGSGSGNATWNQGANGYRLPTEAEWEQACRAVSTTAFANGPITHTGCYPLDPNLDAMGWYCGNDSPSGRKEVGQKQANSWGLYDMHGNLWEWVWDGYRADYQNLSSTDPVHNVGPGADRVRRGGGWDSNARRCRSAYRRSLTPGGYGSDVLGFRPVRSAP